jgi:hypothetical protein
VKPVSGCCEAARELLPISWPLTSLLGVPVRTGGAGLGAFVVGSAAGAGDYEEWVSDRVWTESVVEEFIPVHSPEAHLT